MSGFTQQQCEFSPSSWPRRNGGRGGPGARALGAAALSLHVSLRLGRTHQPLDLSPYPRKMRLEDNDFCETSHWIHIWVRCNRGGVRKRGTFKSWISRLGNRNQLVDWMHFCQLRALGGQISAKKGMMGGY